MRKRLIKKYQNGGTNDWSAEYPVGPINKHTREMAKQQSAQVASAARQGLSDFSKTAVGIASNISSKASGANLIYTLLWNAKRALTGLPTDWSSLNPIDIDSPGKFGSDIFMSELQKQNHPIVAAVVDVATDPMLLYTAANSAVKAMPNNITKKAPGNYFIAKKYGCKNGHEFNNKLAVNNFIGGIELDQLLSDIPLAWLTDAHGISKGHLFENTKQLENILKNGISKNKKLYTAPLSFDPRLPKGYEVAFGTSDGKAYRDGSYILLSDPGKSLEKDGIRAVLINDADGSVNTKEIIKYLKKKYPSYEFVSYKDYPKWVRETYGGSKSTTTEKLPKFTDFVQNELHLRVKDIISKK